MNLKIAVLLPALCVISFSACSKKSNNNNKATMSYELSENGCSTRRREFKGTESQAKSAMCAALQDDGLNCYCASMLREMKFKDSGCGGTYRAKAGQISPSCKP